VAASGQTASGPAQARPPRRPGGRTFRIAIVAVAALALVAALVGWRSATLDSDADGLTDRAESTGWPTEDGTVYRTNPGMADTDGDGLTDLDEAGLAQTDPQGERVYAFYSDPLAPDTDEDALLDSEEADLGLDPRDGDVDDDGLRDGYEIDVVGTDPEAADSDGDGLTDAYEDANRSAQGLDPLWFDEQISTADYLVDFSKGLLAGELLHEDSLAWLAGSLVADAASAAPGVGSVIGGVTASRAAVAAAIEGDFVGAGFDALSVVPVKNLAKLVPKIERFLEGNPRLAVAAADLVTQADKVPDWAKVRVAKVIWPEWDELVAAGADELALLRLQRGRTHLGQLAQALRRPGHAPGAAVGPASDGRTGEQLIQALYGADAAGAQVRLSTAQCAVGCDSPTRIVDVLVDGVAHESKVGRVAWSSFTQRQIRKDAWLISSGQIGGAHWHFVMSSASGSLGADPKVLDLLDEAGITYTIHLPAAA
jgi:hypothetical protein